MTYGAFVILKQTKYIKKKKNMFGSYFVIYSKGKKKRKSNLPFVLSILL